MARTWTKSQRNAIDVTGKSLLVSAAAGSGKTSVLTERIIQSLTGEQKADLSRMLIVTFTRAAAAELKSRIAQALSDALAETPGDERLCAQLLKLGSAQISTIDSFFQKIVRNNFEKLGLTASFRIADDNEILPLAINVLEGLVAEYYERYDADQAVAANTLDAIAQNRFACALDHLLSNRSDGKLHDTLLGFYGGFSSYPEGIELLKTDAKRLREYAEGDFLKSSYGEVYIDFYMPLFEAYLSDLDELEKNMAYDPNVHQKCFPLLDSDRSFCKNVVEALQTRNYLRAQTVVNAFFKGRFPNFKKDTKTKEAEAYQLWRTQFRKNGVDEMTDSFRFTPDQIRDAMLKTADFCEMMHQFYTDYQDRLMKEKNLRGVLEYNDVRMMVYRLLTDPAGNPSDFANDLSSQYDAVYIDEYQDVDGIQDRIFELIGRDCRFMVGDIKQSIYGFRGSDPSIFAEYRRKFPLYGSEGAAEHDGNTIFMSDNFRCDQPVIDFTNRVCSFLFSACEKSVGYRSNDDLKHSKKPPEAPPEGYPFPVCVAVFDKPQNAKEEEEEENARSYNQESAWIASEISRLKREGVLDDGKPIQLSDIAILVRNKKHGKGVTQALKERSIPVASETSVDFLHDPVLVDFLNLLRSIDNPYRDIVLSEFLISPLGGFSLCELAEIRASAEHTRALYDALQDGAQSDALPTELRERILSTLQNFEAWREQASVLSADRFLRLLYQDARWVELCSTPPLLMLYDQARLYQRNAWCGLYGFLQHVEKLIDGEKLSAAGFAKAENAVTVMTIHHSKGLEFPVVFLMSCGSQFNDLDARDSLVYHRQTGAATKLYSPGTANHDETALRNAASMAMKLEQHEENIRTLYVALTRARERLYVSGTLRGKWENAISNVSCIRRGNRTAILSCSNFLSWILAAMCDCEAHNVEFPCILQHISEADADFDPKNTHEKCSVEATTESRIDPAALAYAEIVRRHQSFVYSEKTVQGLPTKAAASKLRSDFLDRYLDDSDEEEFLNSRIELMSARPPLFDRLLGQQNQATAADIGTAMHAFLEFCDFETLRLHGVKVEKERLAAGKFMRTEDMDLIRDSQLEAFRGSELMQLIASAQKIYREQKFSMLVPLSSLSTDSEVSQSVEGRSLYVQGSIDLLLQTQNGELVLVDYKTDRVLDEERANRALLIERMKKKHGMQLSYYAQAVEQLFGKKPDRTMLYLLSIGDMIEF